MTTKLWTKLSDIVKEVAGTMDSDDIKTFMNAWNEHKSEVMKLLGGGLRTKRKKDPNAPKKWKTGYILFCLDKRQEVKDENPNMKATEITKELGARWNALGDKNKKKYEKLSVKDKVRYQKEMENYTPPPEDELEKRGKKGKKERTGPKRPLSSYMYFCQDVRDTVKSENPDMKGPEITKKLGVRWKSLEDEDKVQYEEQAAVDKERYEREKVEMGIETKGKAKSKAKTATKTTKTKTTKTTKTASKTKGKAEPKTTKTKTATKSKKAEPKVTRTKTIKKTPGYEYFVEEQKEDFETEHPSWSTRKITTEVNKKWRELSNEDREAYELEAEAESDEDATEHEASDVESDLDGDLAEASD